MTSKLEARWNSLASSPLHAVFQLYDATHPLDFYIGKDCDQHWLLLLVTSEVPPSIRDMRSISILTFKREDGKWSLLLTLGDPLLAPMFSLLCNDLIESVRNTGLAPSNTLSFVLKRLSYWRKMFERGIPDLLSEMQIRGLCGELLFLRRLCDGIGKQAAVSAWVGPLKSEQDFQIANTAWEVKTIRPNAADIHISSGFQLQTAARKIYLVVFELIDADPLTANHFSLNGLVSAIGDTLCDNYDVMEIFEARLMAASYVNRDEYNKPLLLEKSMLKFEVKNSFPRISQESLMPGVKNVRYEIDLSACADFCINDIF